MCAYIYIFIHMCTCIHTYPYTHIHARLPWCGSKLAVTYLCVYTYMFIRIYIYMYNTHIHISIHTSSNVALSWLVHIYVHMYTFIHPCGYAYTSKYAYYHTSPLVRLWIGRFSYVCIDIYIHLYVYRYIHIHLHMCMIASLLVLLHIWSYKLQQINIPIYKCV